MMGKLSRSKPSKSSSGHSQTSIQSFFSKVPAGQSKLFNQLPPTSSKPVKVNKLSRTANKKAKADNGSKQTTLLEKKKPSTNGKVSGTQDKKTYSSPGHGGSNTVDIITIPETPESASGTPSSSRKATKINIPETPTSSKSTSSRHKASSPSPSRSSTSTYSKTLQRNQNGSLISSKGASKPSRIQGHSGNQSHERSSSTDVCKSNLIDLVAVSSDEGDDECDGGGYSPIPETQFCIPETQLPPTPNTDIKQSPSPNTIKPRSKFDDILSSYQRKKSPSAKVERPQSKFDNILTSYQKKLDSKGKRQSLDKSTGKTTLSTIQLNSERVPSRPRNIFGSHQKEQEKRKGLQKLAVDSNQTSKSDRKVISAKRIGNKLSRTHRKLSGGIGKQTPSSSTKVNREKSACLDQSDLDLLQDCVAENAVLLPPKSLKLSKTKLKNRKVSPAQNLGNTKQLPGLEDDVDCSVLEELLDEVSETDQREETKGTAIKSNVANSKEKNVCLDQSDLDLLLDCFGDDAIEVAPKPLKQSKSKPLKHKVSPPQKVASTEECPEFEDVDDCSNLDELLVELSENHEGDNQAKETSVLKPSKVVLKCPNQAVSSHSKGQGHKDKSANVKIGPQKRSPSRGNSPYAKRIQSELPSLSKPGTHVKSLFQGAHSGLELQEIQSKKGDEKLTTLDELETDDAVCSMEMSQPFTGVKKPGVQDKVPTSGRPDEGAELGSVSALLHRTPGRLKQSPWKPDDVASPGTDGFLDGLDDSFLLAAADMEALDEMEAEAMCQPQPQGKSVDSQLSRGLQMMSPFKSQRSQQTQVKLPADLNRYVVTSIINEDWQKTIHVLDLSDHSTKTCILQGTWFETPLHEGSVVAIHGSFDEQGVCKITPQQNFIIVSPDLLLTGTNVTKSIRCLRRSVLGEKFKGLDKASKPMLLGTTLHEVFDEALAKKCFSVDFLRRVLQKTLKKPPFMADMYSLGLNEKQLTEDAEEYMTTMKHWADRYLQDKPKATATIDIKFPGQMKSEKCKISVSGVKDIEETVWSPRWGLKGKVDITAQVKIHRAQTRSPPKTYTVPLELKTGRQTNSIEHRSQVMLYSVMLGDLDKQAANDLGVLLYVKTGEMLAVPAMQMDKRELLHLRNQLAYSLALPATKSADNKWTTPSLPEPIQDEFTCSKCNYLTSCAVLCSMEQQSSPKLFTEQLAHLSTPHKEYFSHWYLMCALEHMTVEKRNTTKQIWCKEPWEREQKGDCMSGLVLSACRHHQQRDCYLITFKRKTNHQSSVLLSSLPFSLSDRVVIGLEESRIVTCCIGFIDSLTDDQVTITSERAIKMQVGNTYRLDKDDGYNSMASSLVNLVRLMESEQSRIRGLVVDLEKPVYDPSPTLPGANKQHVTSILKTLNSNQQEAINRVLCSQQYTLVVGMPGTGKTTTIVGLVRILHACGLSVLLTSYTHSAVDNILLKLCKYGIDFLRLGSKHRVHPDLQKYTEDVMLSQIGSVQQLGTVLETKPVVATTCLGAKNKLLTQRMFDVCIVDEASQIGQLVCLGPLYVANRFVLVGDHQQLPPLVQSHAARQLGMDESLFQRLALHRPESSIQLSLQYRMNRAIMDISNELVYNGKLQCGNEVIANATLHIPQYGMIQQSYPGKWFLRVLDPVNPVAFLNIDKVEKHVNDTTGGKPTVNHTEAELVMVLVNTLIQGGCKPSSIGVIAPYRLQCKLLSGMMEKSGSIKDVEINTVDKYQGRDKEVIIVSFTHRQIGQELHRHFKLNWEELQSCSKKKGHFLISYASPGPITMLRCSKHALGLHIITHSLQHCKVGTGENGAEYNMSGLLLEDMRRLNVAVTRAKHKLILLGSVSALRKLQTMQQLLNCLANNKQISDLPPDALRD